MLYQELPLPFPVYDSISKQARFNLNTDEPCGSSLISASDAILPFQLRKVKTSEVPSKMEILMADDDSLAVDISAAIPALKTVSRLGLDYLTHLGQRLTNPATGQFMDLKTGEYYVRITFPDGTLYYTETFRIPVESFTLFSVARPCKFLKLEWSNPTDIPPIYYAPAPADRLINRVFLDTNIQNSEPETEVEGTQTGDNVLIPNFQKVSLKYKISDVVPDFLKLALAVMPIHDNIVLTTEYGKRSGQILNVSVESEADENGYFSDVTITFEDALVIRHGCNDAMLTDPCPQLPAPGVVALNASEAPGFAGIRITANIPLGVYADIYTSRANNLGTLSQARIYRSQLTAGFTLPYSQAYGPYVTLVLRTFECTLGNSATVNANIPYDVKLGAYRYAIQTDPAAMAANDNIFAHRGGAMAIYNDLFTGLRAGTGSLWDKAYAIYPFWGEGGDSNRFNAKDPRDLDAAFRLTGGGGIADLGTAGDFGMVINGAASGEFLDTHFNPATVSDLQSLSMILTTSNFLAIQNYNGLVGSWIAAGRQWGIQFAGSNVTAYAYGNGINENVPLALGSSPKAGRFFLSRRAANDFEFRKDGSTTINPGGNISIPPSRNVTLGKMNGSPAAGSDVQASFLLIGSGYTSPELDSLEILISNFNSAIAFGR